MSVSPQDNLSDSPSTLSSKPAKPVPSAIGRWTKEEHQRFIDGIRKYGKNWKQVEDYVGTRTGAQIRSHAQKFFNRLEREYNLRIDGSRSQISQQITESLRKMSEASGSTNTPAPNEVSDDVRVEEGNPSIASTNSKEVQSQALQPVDFENPGSRNVFFEETQSVPPDSPKLAPLSEGVSSFRRNMRKMSEDVIVKHSLSMFEVIMSKIRTSKNGIDFPKLSDLVDFGLKPSTNFRSTTNNKPVNKEKEYQQEVEMKENIDQNMSFRVNPRKISEDNILLSNKVEQNKKTSGEELNEFEILEKKVKKD